jgi:hypothetical protein
MFPTIVFNNKQIMRRIANLRTFFARLLYNLGVRDLFDHLNAAPAHVDVNYMVTKFLDEPVIKTSRLKIAKDESVAFQVVGGFDPPRTLARLIIQTAQTKEPSSTRDVDRTSPLCILGLALGIRRRNKKIGIEELANRVGVESKIIYAIEVGVAPLGTVSENLSEICAALDLNYTRISKLMADLTLGTVPS